MKKLVNDWIILAEKDVKAASVIINEEYLTNIVACHCQQAIEKYRNNAGTSQTFRLYRSRMRHQGVWQTR
jgi:hypothetical protein